MINLSSSTPVAETGYVLGKWQEDASGNVSVELPFGGITKQNVSPSSSPAGVLTLDCSKGNSFTITVNQVISSMSLTNPTDGQEITLLWKQDSSGHAITLATNLKGATAPSTGANTVSCQRFTYDTGSGNWYSCAAGSTGM